MPAIKIDRFDGVYPRKGTYQLGDFEAQTAENVKLFSGELRAWQKPVEVTPQPALRVNPETIYRLERPTDQASVWLSWQVDVDVVPSPIADTNDGRIYYTGEATPRKTNYAIATSGAAPYPFDYLELGLPKPTPTPTGSSTGGTGGVQTRVYIYTFISTFGAVKEESQPSDPVTITSQVTGATVTLNDLGTAAPAGKYNITHKRIYRAVGGNTTLDYRLVAEIPITQGTYTDTLNDADLPGDVLISLDFTPPPATLKGLVSMPGGFLAGFVRNEVWFSEPNYPHAWPAKYVLTASYNVVGLGVVGNLLVVMTERSPELIYGQSPDTLGQEKIPLVEPCASKRSIATDGNSVIYASPNGLVGIGPGMRARFTDRLFRRDEFQFYGPASIYARVYDGTYFGWFGNGANQGAMLINSTDTPAMSVLGAFTNAAFVDTRTAALYYVDADNKLVEFDASLTDNASYVWRSKKFDLPFPTSFGVLQLYADYDFIAGATYDPAQDIAFNQNLITTGTVNGAINTAPVNKYAVNGSALRRALAASDIRNVSVVVYGDGQQVVTHGFTDERHKKLPSGRKYRTWEIEVRGNVPVRAVALASTAADLKDV